MDEHEEVAKKYVLTAKLSLLYDSSVGGGHRILEDTLEDTLGAWLRSTSEIIGDAESATLTSPDVSLIYRRFAS